MGTYVLPLSCYMVESTKGLLMKIPITKQVNLTVDNGHLEITKVGDSFFVDYVNALYKGSPFRCTVSYGVSWTPHEISRDSEVLKLISRVTGEH